MMRFIRCPNCGQKHKDPSLHRCHWSNPEGVIHAERVREMDARIKQQRWKCLGCRYELPAKGNTLEQFTVAGVVCRSCFQKGDERE